MRLTFRIMNGYRAGRLAGDATTVFDTTLAEDVAAATAEFQRLLSEGRTAVTESGHRVDAPADLPTAGIVYWVLPIVGG